jgi:hypothetical protein
VRLLDSPGIRPVRSAFRACGPDGTIRRFFKPYYRVFDVEFCSDCHELQHLPKHNLQGTVDYYRHMLRVKPGPAGLDRADASLMMRHAMGCLGYHLGNSRLGIPEPPVLDPYCGAASLAASLKYLGLPFDRRSVASLCSVTEEGSNLQDLLDAGKKLGASTYPVSADDRGLMAMPKPAIAFVEEDHFISVVRADKKGVAYLCSDCGAWPGGEVNLTWKQWHQMEPGFYGVVVQKSSNWDRFLARLTSLKPKAAALGPVGMAKALTGFSPGLQVCSSVSASNLHLASAISRLLPVSQLIAHLAILGDPARQVACGNSAESAHCCLPCGTCPSASGGSGNGSTGSGGSAGKGGGSGGGASAGDPVNLATGEEEYTPDPDLNVYNPIGPSVSFSRIYHSLRAPHFEAWYESSDFGQGWSYSYNIGVEDPTLGGFGPSQDKYIFMPNGGRILFTAPAVPTPSNPSVQCVVQPGFAYL